MGDNDPDKGMNNDLLAIIAVLVAVLALFGPFLHAIELGNQARDRLVGIAEGSQLDREQFGLLRSDWASFAYGSGCAAAGFGLLFLALGFLALADHLPGITLGRVGALALLITGFLFLGAGLLHLYVSHFSDAVAIGRKMKGLG